MTSGCPISSRGSPARLAAGAARTSGPIGNRLKCMPDKGWRRHFDEPIPLPRGRQLVTLEDAGHYITKLSKAEHEAAEWQARDGSADPGGGDVGRPDDVCADWHHAGSESPGRARIQFVAEGSSLGTVETDPRSMPRSLTASSACATCSRNEITSDIFRRSILCENKRLRGFSSGTLFKLN
jgi:hypothetical protein